MKVIQAPQKGAKRFWQAKSEGGKVSRSAIFHLPVTLAVTWRILDQFMTEGANAAKPIVAPQPCYSCPESLIHLLHCFSCMLKCPLFFSVLLLPLIVQKGFLNAYLLPTSYNSCILEERQTSSFWSRMFIFSMASIDWGTNKLRVLGVNWLEQGWLTLWLNGN